MRHLVYDEQASKEIGDGKLIFYSCEYDDGRKVRNADPLRVGPDGNICLMLCQSCGEQIKEQVLQDVIVSSLHMSKALSRNPRRVFYKGLCLEADYDYELPAIGSSEMSDIFAKLDEYLEKGTPLSLYGMFVYNVEDRRSIIKKYSA